jgi:hypothetical protein
VFWKFLGLQGRKYRFFQKELPFFEGVGKIIDEEGRWKR